MGQDTQDEQLWKHDARNESLLARLRELGALLDVARPIDCHFWAPNAESAEELRVILIGKGLREVQTSAPADDDTTWSVQGQLLVRPDLMGSRGMTLELVQLATSCGAKYDGWGTSVSEARPHSVDGTRGGPTMR